MKQAITALVVAFSAFGACAAEVEPMKLPAGLEQIRLKARSGDYHAQRNLAYAYATGGQELAGNKYPVAACAWYMSIPYLHEASRVDMGDMSNAWTYCTKLQPDAHEAAMRHSVKIVGSLRKQ